MQQALSDREILAKYGIIFDGSQDRKLSQFGGLAPVFQMLKKGRIRERLEELLGPTKARSILQLGLSILAGGKSLEDGHRVAQDPVVQKFLKNPVGPVELGRNFKSFSRSQIESFHDFNRSLAMLELAQLIPQEEEIIFDVDATAVEKYGSQEGVEHGYVERDKIESCYQYLFFRCHNLNTFFYGTVRAGSSHSQNGWVEYLEQFLPPFKKQWKVCIRADSGYFSERMVDCTAENEARFFVKAAMIVTRQNLAQNSADLVWFADSRSGSEYASYLTNTGRGTPYREIYRRTKVENNQLSLLESAAYRYDCLTTNDLIITEAEAFLFYNGRANIENNIRELKNDWSLGKIVTDDFDANDVITQVILFFYILLSHLKRTVFPEEMKRHQLSTLRTRLFNIPAGLFRTARKNWSRIQNAFSSEKIYAAIMRGIESLRSWILAPPELKLS